MSVLPIINVENLVKVFRINQKDPGGRGAIKALVQPRHIDKAAVDGISFRVEPGEGVGYIGVNGAGKFTTIRCSPAYCCPAAGRCACWGATRTASGWLT